MESNKESIGKRIKKFREFIGKTQADLAKELNVKRETINQWENGTRDIKTEYTVKLADYFKTTCDYILRGVEPENVNTHRDLGLSEEAIETLKHLQEYKRKPSESSHDVLGTINFLLENMKNINLIGLIAKYFACDYEAIITKDLHELISNSMIDASFASRNNIFVREKSTGEISAIGAELLPTMYLKQLEKTLVILRDKYNKEVKNNGEHNQADK